MTFMSPILNNLYNNFETNKDTNQHFTLLQLINKNVLK
jgi:hypothetical protein